MASVGNKDREKGGWVRVRSVVLELRACLETEKPACTGLRYSLKKPRVMAGLRVARKERVGLTIEGSEQRMKMGSRLP